MNIETLEDVTREVEAVCKWYVETVTGVKTLYNERLMIIAQAVEKLPPQMSVEAAAIALDRVQLMMKQIQALDK